VSPSTATAVPKASPAAPSTAKRRLRSTYWPPSDSNTTTDPVLTPPTLASAGTPTNNQRSLAASAAPK
jgi:hypothetical protein